jgi:hypothetical protein
MALFNVSKPSSAAKTGASEASLVITAGSTKPLRIHMADVAGNGTASAANEVVLQRVTGTATGGTSITPSKVNPASGVAGFSASYDATGGLTYTADTIQRRFAVNANGGYIPFTPLPGFHIPVAVGTSIAFKSLAGTSNIVINVSIEEVDD